MTDTEWFVSECLIGFDTIAWVRYKFWLMVLGREPGQLVKVHQPGWDKPIITRVMDSGVYGVKDGKMVKVADLDQVKR